MEDNKPLKRFKRDFNERVMFDIERDFRNDSHTKKMCYAVINHPDYGSVIYISPGKSPHWIFSNPGQIKSSITQAYTGNGFVTEGFIKAGYIEIHMLDELNEFKSSMRPTEYYKNHITD